MNPTAARAFVIMLSFAVLGLSAIFASIMWSLLGSLQLLPRGVFSLLVFVTAYYFGANLVLWKTVVRISASQLSQRP